MIANIDIKISKRFNFLSKHQITLKFSQTVYKTMKNKAMFETFLPMYKFWVFVL